MTIPLCLALLTSSSRGQRFNIFELSSLPPGSQPVGINNFGQVVGNYSQNAAQYAFLWERDSAGNVSVTVLPNLGGGGNYPFTSGSAINNAGQVAGTSSALGNLPLHAFRWDQRSGIRDLMTLGGMDSRGYGLNDNGQVVGISHLSGQSGIHAFRYDDNGGMLDLGSLNADLGSEAWAINSLGQVVGNANVLNSSGQIETHAFRTAPNAIISPTTDDLGTLGGARGYAYAINMKGRVVGQAETATRFVNHAFCTAPNSAINIVTDDLGTFGGTESGANSINNSDQVVGYADTVDDEARAFLWENGQLMDLNDLIPENSAWELWNAQGINDRGQIVGTGLHDGQFRAFFLTPVMLGVDISYSAKLPPDTFWKSLRDAGYNFVIHEGWTGLGAVHASEQNLKNARTNGLLTAGYCYLNFVTNKSAACQVYEAIVAFGTEAEHLSFIAIDVEDAFLPSGLKTPPYDRTEQTKAVGRIAEAVETVADAGLRPVYLHGTFFLDSNYGQHNPVL